MLADFIPQNLTVVLTRQFRYKGHSWRRSIRAQSRSAYWSSCSALLWYSLHFLLLAAHFLTRLKTSGSHKKCLWVWFYSSQNKHLYMESELFFTVTASYNGTVWLGTRCSNRTVLVIALMHYIVEFCLGFPFKVWPIFWKKQLKTRFRREFRRLLPCRHHHLDHHRELTVVYSELNQFRRSLEQTLPEVGFSSECWLCDNSRNETWTFETVVDCSFCSKMSTACAIKLPLL